MGNRAVITTTNKEMGVYVHWNGGRTSVEGFLAYCKMMGYRKPETDCYGWARLVQTIANFFGSDGLSVGVDKYTSLDCDNWDNGVYIVKDWHVVGREFQRDEDEEVNLEDLTGMMLEINKCQPEGTQQPEEKVREAARQYMKE